MIKDYEDFNVKIDDMNDACNTCDAMQRGNTMSPVRRSKDHTTNLLFVSY